MESFESFKKEVQKLSCKRKSTISNSYGVYDIYKVLRKNHWEGIGTPIKEHEFYSIIRGINKLLAAELLKGNSITFPHSMGGLYLVKTERNPYFKDGKLKINYPIDWDKTLKLWYDNPEARKDKVLMRKEEHTVYKIVYRKGKATYTNKSVYDFAVNRSIKRTLKEKIASGETDTLYEERKIEML